MLLHSNSGYANAPQCHIYTLIACFVFIAIEMIRGVVIFLHAFESRGEARVLSHDIMKKCEQFSASVRDADEW